MEKVNKFFGNAYIFMGTAKALLVLIAIFSLLVLGNVDVTMISAILGFIQMGVMLGSFIMIFANFGSEPGKSLKYLLGLLTLCLELILPSLIYMFVLFPQCAYLLNIGSKLKNGDNSGTGTKKSQKEINQTLKNTEWFYGPTDDNK